jgi:hypothetical protein
MTNQGSLSSFRPLTKWGVHRFALKWTQTKKFTKTGWAALSHGCAATYCRTFSKPDPDPWFLWPTMKEKYTAENKIYLFLSKFAIYLSIGLHNKRPR